MAAKRVLNSLTDPRAFPMMLLSVLGRTAQAVGGSGSAIMITMASFGGALIPLVAMPEWMLTMSHFIPVKWAILALEGPIWRGFNLAEMLLPSGILLAIGVLSFGPARVLMTDTRFSAPAVNRGRAASWWRR